jgi:hypothetical protein
MWAAVNRAGQWIVDSCQRESLDANEEDSLSGGFGQKVVSAIVLSV